MACVTSPPLKHPWTLASGLSPEVDMNLRLLLTRKNVLTCQAWEEENKVNCDFCEYL